jgi:hypothetical protein
MDTNPLFQKLDRLDSELNVLLSEAKSHNDHLATLGSKLRRLEALDAEYKWIQQHFPHSSIPPDFYGGDAESDALTGEEMEKQEGEEGRKRYAEMYGVERGVVIKLLGTCSTKRQV